VVADGRRYGRGWDKKFKTVRPNVESDATTVKVRESRKEVGGVERVGQSLRG
jgi:hypothetical protein